MKAPSPFSKHFTLDEIRKMEFTVTCAGKTLNFQPVTFGYEGIELEAMTALNSAGIKPPQKMRITIYDGNKEWYKWDMEYPETPIYLGTTPLGNRLFFYPAEARYGKTNDMPEW